MFCCELVTIAKQIYSVLSLLVQLKTKKANNNTASTNNSKGKQEIRQEMKSKIENWVEYGGAISRARVGLGWVRLPLSPTYIFKNIKPPPSVHISKPPTFTLTLQIVPPLLYTLLKFSYVGYSLH